MASEKVLILGIQRVRGSRYFLRDQAVYRAPFFRGPPRVAAQEEWVVDASFEAAKGYHYFLDADGDLARVKKRIPGRRPAAKRPCEVLPRRCAPEDASFADLLSGLTASSLRRLASRLGLAPPGGPQQIKEVLVERGGPQAGAILHLLRPPELLRLLADGFLYQGRRHLLPDLLHLPRPTLLRLCTAVYLQRSLLPAIVANWTASSRSPWVDEMSGPAAAPYETASH